MEYLQAIMQMEVMVFMVVVAAMVEVELLIRPGVAHTSVHRSLAETVKEVQFVLCGAPTQQLLERSHLPMWGSYDGNVYSH